MKKLTKTKPNQTKRNKSKFFSACKSNLKLKKIYSQDQSPTLNKSVDQRNRSTSMKSEVEKKENVVLPFVKSILKNKDVEISIDRVRNR